MLYTIKSVYLVEGDVDFYRVVGVAIEGEAVKEEEVRVALGAVGDIHLSRHPPRGGEGVSNAGEGRDRGRNRRERRESGHDLVETKLQYKGCWYP